MMEDRIALYRIMDVDRSCGFNVVFWMPDSKGYTLDVDKAGAYPWIEASEIARLSQGAAVMLRVGDVQKASFRGLRVDAVAEIVERYK